MLASLGMTSVSKGILPRRTFLKSDDPIAACSTSSEVPLILSPSLAGIAMSREVRELETGSWPELAGSATSWSGNTRQVCSSF